MPRASLRDVAQHAGVSVKTVSNVVHGYTHVSTRTRDRVQRALQELDYRPNLVARGLRLGKIGVVTLVVPALSEPYFAELASLLIEQAAEQELTVFVEQTAGQRHRERLIFDGAGAFATDALVLSPLSLMIEDLGSRRADTPVVLLGEHLGPKNGHHVGIDNVAAARLATDHLLGLGRRRVAAIGVQRGVLGPARLRLRGYRNALLDKGIEPRSEWEVATSVFSRLEGVRGMAQLLKQRPRPDAVFCFNDSLALGSLATLRDHGVRVPEDIAVIGLDDIEDSSYSSPRLSTVAIDKPGIARAVVEVLVELLDGAPQLPYRDVRCRHQLVIRESTVGGA